MKLTVATLGLALTLSFGILTPILAQEDDEGEITKTRFGKITYGEDKDDDLVKIAYLNGNELLRYEGLSLGTETVLSDGGIDYVIIAQNSGGTACPVEFVILRLEAKKKPVLSEGFGTCSDIAKARVESGNVIVESMPYFPNPDEISEKELRSAKKVKVVFTWANGAGKITEKTVKK
jgi:hypothetical protein